MAETQKNETATSPKKPAAKKKAPAKRKPTAKKTPYDLVIVESPAKAKTINKFLGSGYKVAASNGHVRDLPKSTLGVDLENDFEPKYIQIRGKKDVVNALKSGAAGATKIYLATDPDREGEAISWHIANMLGEDVGEVSRIEFNEITKKAVTAAITNPRKIDIDLVDAQQARRVLDRLVGYKLSPLLWKKVKTGLSAGRVQSVAVRIICDREAEIEAFVPEEFWTIAANLFDSSKNHEFEAKYFGKDGKKQKVENKQQSDEVLAGIKGKDFVIDAIKKGTKKKNSAPPFTTSYLQQAASSKLGFTARRTMLIAQQLYEGVEIKGSGAVGLVTYIRTDSTRVSEDALTEVRAHIEKEYGKEYLPEKPRYFKKSKKAQDAHEAIRPSYMEYTPESLKSTLTKDQYKLYKLIYSRFVASQMNPSQYETMSVTLDAGGYTFKASGSRQLFKGYTAAYMAADEQTKDNILPKLHEGEVCPLKSVIPKQNFTQPPSRYNEASLVRALEEKGIGRPSTYAPIISTIQDRRYIEKEGRNLKPTFLGGVVNDLMKANFADIVNVEFTAELENKLDDIENGGKEWKRLLAEFYGPFEKTLEDGYANIERVVLPIKESDVICEKCGKTMIYKDGRFGEFLACPGYPECKNTKPIIKYIDAPCPKCGKRIVEKKSNKRKKIFYGCEGYPDCDFVSWDMPIDEKCKECNSMMALRRRSNGKSYKKCSNPECVTNQRKKTEEKTDEE
ncbi:MAG: type I DNA topoisomerase [Clostridia bacterium]|jgi:DNA topoisomerase I|nr:type I DNA topoisomerase [Clostridia bacterium]MBT7122306.1 type I DNA topoisomerase [Clostridia bacterium]